MSKAYDRELDRRVLALMYESSYWQCPDGVDAEEWDTAVRESATFAVVKVRLAFADMTEPFRPWVERVVEAMAKVLRWGRP